jgi:hypothetical protein
MLQKQKLLFGVTRTCLGIQNPPDESFILDLEIYHGLDAPIVDVQLLESTIDPAVGDPIRPGESSLNGIIIPILPFTTRVS